MGDYVGQCGLSLSWEEAQYRVSRFDWDRVRQAEQELGVIQRLQSFQTEAYRLERVGV